MSDDLSDLRAMTADIVASYVASRNHVQASELANLIQSIHSALAGLAEVSEPKPAVAEPAVPIRKAVTPDAITCLSCGKRFKALKRHIRGDHGQTPQEYRAQWGLPPTFPMVAPNYAAARSALAVAMGLGQGGRVGNAVDGPGSTPAAAAESTTPATPKRRGRPPKAAS